MQGIMTIHRMMVIRPALLGLISMCMANQVWGISWWSLGSGMSGGSTNEVHASVVVEPRNIPACGVPCGNGCSGRWGILGNTGEYCADSGNDVTAKCIVVADAPTPPDTDIAFVTTADTEHLVIGEVSLLDISGMNLYLEVDNHEECESAPPYMQNANKALTAALATGTAADRAEAASELCKYLMSSRWCPGGGLRYFGELVLMIRTALKEGILTQAEVGTKDTPGTLGYAAHEAFDDIPSDDLGRAGKQMGCVAVCSYWGLSRPGVPHYNSYIDLSMAHHGTEFASSAYDYVGTLAMVAHSIVINLKNA